VVRVRERERVQVRVQVLALAPGVRLLAQAPALAPRVLLVPGAEQAQQT